MGTRTCISTSNHFGKKCFFILEKSKSLCIWYNANISRYPFFEPIVFEKKVRAQLYLLTSKEQLMSAVDIMLNFKTSP